ncbi:MAG: 2-oxoglutarate dehydrogenase complex dihydrolipoyllysine-residue succinyltransferase [Gammaproteobacteria bacterium]|nr:MAG: 2-oxoglutarate dehydrogenase complex dihydrolipoyllysine-residue succinyltransferase [Gammaproteobacteria bacterium]
MSIEIKAPAFPESIAEGTVATWHKQPGEACKRDEVLVDIETDKVVLEVVAPADGVIETVLKAAGEIVLSQELLATFKEGAGGTGPAPAKPVVEDAKPVVDAEQMLNPAARQLVEENNLDASAIKGTGRGGRITKEDVLKHLESQPAKAAAPAPAATTSPSAAVATAPAPVLEGQRPERRVPMTRLRARVAERLLDATQTTAMLTTFNEVNMKPIMDLRAKYKDEFMKRHNGTKLGFMSFFVRASVEALKRFPIVNASIDGNDIVYHGYQDIGVAVSTERGLVVPILRNADFMSLADMERTIAELGEKARDNRLGIDEITGGTFTITNGGVFGSLLSTPILNPPQTAILGMHKIQERPMAVNGEVKILPMMYLALSYDHRLIDGKDAVSFLIEIKDLLEEPARILLDL